MSPPTDPTPPTGPIGAGSQAMGSSGSGGGGDSGGPGYSEVWVAGDGTEVRVSRVGQVRTYALGRRGGDGKGGVGKVPSLVVLLLVGVFVSLIGTILLLIAIWPGEAKLTGALLCPDDRTDVFIVSDTVSDGEGGTSTDYTMYCVDERGDATEIHFLLPFLVLWAAHTVLLVLVFVIWSLLSPGVRRAARAAERKAQQGALVGMSSSPPVAASTSGAAGGSGSGSGGSGFIGDAGSLARPDDETDFEPPGPIIS